MRPIPGTQCGVLKESGMEIPPEALHLIKSGLNKLGGDFQPVEVVDTYSFLCVLLDRFFKQRPFLRREK